LAAKRQSSGSAKRESSGSARRESSGSAKRESSGSAKRQSSGSRTRASSNGKVGARDAVKRAVEQVAELTSRPVEGVLGVERADDQWVVTLELLELRRVPDSTDVLASYAVVVDDRGELQQYRRTHRYYRSQVEGD